MMQILASLLLTAPTIFLKALVFWDLWRWFMLPLGAPELASVWHAAGLVVTQQLITTRVAATSDKRLKGWKTPVLSMIFSVWVWCIAALLHWGMAG